MCLTTKQEQTNMRGSKKQEKSVEELHREIIKDYMETMRPWIRSRKRKVKLYGFK